LEGIATADLSQQPVFLLLRTFSRLKKFPSLRVLEFEKELQTQPGLELGFNSTIPPIAHNPDIEICVIPHQISVQ
jgi:hypothetical protein